MSENNVQGLRDLLFETIKALKDPKDPMEIQRAKAVSNAAQVIVNSAKVEVEYMKVTGGKGSGFIPELEDQSDKKKGVTVERKRSSWQ